MKKKWLIIILVAVVIGALGVWLSKRSTPVQYTTVDLVRTNLVQTVSEVGTVKASKELELNFSTVGRLSKIDVAVGNLVKKDQILLELDQSSLLIKEQEARSALEVARANLRKILAGATPSELAVYESQVNQARTAYLAAQEDYQKAKDSVDETIAQAQKKLNDLQSTSPLINSYQQSINNNRNNLLISADSKVAAAGVALDYADRILSDKDIEDLLSVRNTIYLSYTKNYYSQARILEATAKNALAAAKTNSSEANLDSMIASVGDYLSVVFQVTSNLFSVLENSITSASFTQAELETFKTNVNSHTNTISTAISAMQSASYTYKNSLVALTDAIKTAQNNLSSAQVNGRQQLATASSRIDSTRESWDLTQKQLAKVKTPARNEDVALAQAQVAQADANLNLVKKQQVDNTILAPMDGQITKINYEIGEQVNAAKAAVTMLTENNFEVEVDISESDISKVKVNNPAVITFDALGESRKFKGTVYFIEPASTVISDVIYYKVKVKLIDDANTLLDIKAGMTANVIITTNSKENVLAVPSRAILEKNGDGKFVRVLRDKDQMEEVVVRVGLSGSEGLVEVTSPQLQEGDKIVTFIKNGK